VNRVDPRSRRAWRPGPGAILCSRHFAEGDFERYGLRRKLRRGAVPSRFLPSVRPVPGSLPAPPREVPPCAVTSPFLLPWLSNNEAAAGFSSDIFLRLQEKVERGDQGYRYCAVLVQDVSLRKQQEWDPQSKRLMGFVD
uniref:THAP-type domain-containing protein n=1 Tax=Cyanoderma ruficeps TaxID=181631 RepID=A0A8C3RGW9_9PASS